MGASLRIPLPHQPHLTPLHFQRAYCASPMRFYTMRYGAGSQTLECVAVLTGVRRALSRRGRRAQSAPRARTQPSFPPTHTFTPSDPPCSQWTANPKLREWVAKQAALCKPDAVHLCTGSLEESAALTNQLVLSGTLVKLNQEKWPGCVLARSTTADVARVESRTFICSEREWRGLGRGVNRGLRVISTRLSMCEPDYVCACAC